MGRQLAEWDYVICGGGVMRYYKISGGYIVAPRFIQGAQEINRTEYENFISIVRNKPEAPEGYDYKLTDSLEWELYELPSLDDEEISDAEALEILLGGTV